LLRREEPVPPGRYSIDLPPASEREPWNIVLSLSRTDSEFRDLGELKLKGGYRSFRLPAPRKVVSLRVFDVEQPFVARPGTSSMHAQIHAKTLNARVTKLSFVTAFIYDRPKHAVTITSADHGISGPTSLASVSQEGNLHIFGDAVFLVSDQHVSDAFDRVVAAFANLNIGLRQVESILRPRSASTNILPGMIQADLYGVRGAAITPFGAGKSPDPPALCGGQHLVVTGMKLPRHKD
jgi:hypothetical protein